jgi:hypothetical protein
VLQTIKDFIYRFLPKQQGKRELIFVIALFAVIAGAGFVGGATGILHKDVPTSGTPTATVSAPATEDLPATTTPNAD